MDFYSLYSICWTADKNNNKNKLDKPRMNNTLKNTDVKRERIYTATEWHKDQHRSATCIITIICLVDLFLWFILKTYSTSFYFLFYFYFLSPLLILFILIFSWGGQGMSHSASISSLIDPFFVFYRMGISSFIVVVGQTGPLN